MRSAAAAAVLMSVCNSGDGNEPVAPAYDCAHMFDEGCRFEATVQWNSGRLEEARIAWSGGVTDYDARIEGMSAAVEIVDTWGEHPPVSCSLAVTASFEAVHAADELDATWSITAALDSACPVSCPWFLPSSGSYSDDAGRFGLGYFEGQFEVQWGPTGTDPSYTEWSLPFELADTHFAPEDGEIELLEPAALYPVGYIVPATLDGAATPSACTP